MDHDFAKQDRVKYVGEVGDNKGKTGVIVGFHPIEPWAVVLFDEQVKLNGKDARPQYARYVDLVKE